MKLIYLAGPMRGIPEFNFPAFHAAAAKLRNEGHFVFNPVEKASERNNGSLEQEICDDLTYIAIGGCTAIALLPGWEHSEGARVEFELAKLLRREFIYL